MTDTAPSGGSLGEALSGSGVGFELGLIVPSLLGPSSGERPVRHRHLFDTSLKYRDPKENRPRVQESTPVFRLF